MGQNSKKFHITDDGTIYRLEDSGEVTELGNVDTISGITRESSNQYLYGKRPNDSRIRYSLYEMEKMLCDGKGRSLNKHERKYLASESSNVPALERFVEFSGTQWINILVSRFERGETFLEPVLAKAAQDGTNYIERLASCKRPYSDTSIYHNLYKHKIPKITDALKANPNSPYYEPGFVPKSEDGGGGCCLGIILVLIVSAAATSYLL